MSLYADTFMQMLKKVAEYNASDIYLTTGAPPHCAYRASS